MRLLYLFIFYGFKIKEHTLDQKYIKINFGYPFMYATWKI